MPNNERQSVEMQMSGGPQPATDWRRALLGWGFLNLIAAVFVGAATKMIAGKRPVVDQLPPGPAK